LYGSHRCVSTIDDSSNEPFERIATVAERPRPATWKVKGSIATKKNPKQGTRLGMEFLASIFGFWAGGGVGGRRGVPPGPALISSM